MAGRRWQLAERDAEAEDRLAADLGISRVLATLLRNRGFADLATARAFLQPRLSDLEDPSALRDMDRAAERLARAARAGEKVVIYGDYDVDGMSGAVILLEFLRLAGARAEAYIPDRLTEGYSFQPEAVGKLLADPEPPTLVVSVDHGTSAGKMIERLAEAGVDVIVTDHHLPPDVLPPRAYAIVNPRREDCGSTEKNLCGAAVAFKTAWAAARTHGGTPRVSGPFREFLLDAMALVALATVSGLYLLLHRTRLSGKPVKPSHVGFRLGPRLNAAGRMGLAGLVLELLTTRDAGRAAEVAERLEKANEERRKIDATLLEEILALPDLAGFTGRQGICLADRSWHVGVMGILAARLVDRFDVPALVGVFEGETGRASARAPAGIHLKEVLDATGEHLVSWGGHAAAAGCTFRTEDFPAFKAAFEEVTARALRTADRVPEQAVDLELPLTSVHPDLLEELARLEPFGAGNPTPVFCARNLVVAVRPRTMGRDRAHMAMHVRQGESTFRAVWWNGAEAGRSLAVHDRVDLCFRLRPDDWSGADGVELEVIDLVSHSAGSAAAL